jgi:YegS/Rv2252/BmrU family lipid kinase
MKRRTAKLIINPRAGENVAKLTDLLAVFSAADWKTDIALREFGGHTAQLAKEAAEAGYDLVIGYGGDGTLNQVVNGVMAAERRRTMIGLIPGGTANVWAHEVGISEDPVKAALLLVNSEGRMVDLGHVEADSLPLPPEAPERQEMRSRGSGGRHHFLLMAGLGIDAAILRRVSASRKRKLGTAAVALAVARELPFQHAFPLEIRSRGDGSEDGVLWRGKALQVIVGNTRLYGNIAELTPEAHIDDGVLDVCVITAGNPLTTIGQILATLLRRKARHGASAHFQGERFWMTVPASVGLQLDGSRVKRRDCLAAPDRASRRRAEDPEATMMTYRFDAMPRALRVVIPCTYAGPLFENGAGKTGVPAAEREQPDQGAAGTEPREFTGARHQGPGQLDALLAHGQRVTVVGVGPNPERRGTIIVAGGTSEKRTGESRPVAVRIDHNTTLVEAVGEPFPAAFPAGLVEGGVIVVDGRESKRGVIRAKHVAVMA